MKGEGSPTRGTSGARGPSGKRADGLRIVVTGGAGFIGSELTAQLAQKGHRVTALDNLVNGSRENLAAVLGDRVQLVEADVRDAEVMGKILHGTDVVFHLACLGVRHSIHSPRENHEVNATATLDVLMRCREENVGRFVYVSSSEVYGSACDGPLTERQATLPTTVYGAAKLAGESYARAFHETYGVPTVVVRPFNTFGPRCHHEGDCGEVIPKFMLRCLAGREMIIFGDGTHTRDFTFVSDTAAGILQAGFCDAAIGRTINLGTGTEVSIRALAGEVGRVCGRRDADVKFEAPRPGDVPRLCADTTLARTMWGFAPRVELAEGLRRLRTWYEGSGRSAEELLTEEVVHNWDAHELEAVLT